MSQENFPQNPSSTATKPSSVTTKPEFDDYGYYKKYGRTSKAWNDFVKNGFEAYDKQDCEQVIANLKQAIAAGCNDPIIFFKLGACSELTGSYYSAAQYYKQAEDGLKTLPSPHRYAKDFNESYGRVLYMNKKVDEAISYLMKAGETGTPSFSLYYFLGELYSAKGDKPTALNYFTKAMSQPLDLANPNQLGRVYGAVGKAYLEMKDSQNAIRYLDMALKYIPTDPDIQQTRYRAGDLKRQEEMFKMMEGITTPGQQPPFKPIPPR